MELSVAFLIGILVIFLLIVIVRPYLHILESFGNLVVNPCDLCCNSLPNYNQKGKCKKSCKLDGGRICPCCYKNSRVMI